MTSSGTLAAPKCEDEFTLAASPPTSHHTKSEEQQPRLAARVPIVPAAAAVFLLGFAGSVWYGVRAGRRAELKEAAELAASTSRQAHGSSTTHAVTATPSALSTKGRPQDLPRHSTAAPAKASSSATSVPALNWSNSGSSAPSVLSKRGAGITRSLDSLTTTASDGREQDGSFEYDESPAWTAIKAVSIATALVGASCVAAAEVARRVWKVEDMYDLTDRLHSRTPKSSALFEKLGSFLRHRLEGILPEPEDIEDSLAVPLPADYTSPSTSETARTAHSQPQSLDILHTSIGHPKTTCSLPNRGDANATQPEVKDMEKLFLEIEQAATMRERLALLELQLRSEKADEDRQRESLRRQRELCSSSLR